MSFEQKLIDAVQVEPAIYNKHIREYKDTETKERAWKRVSEKVGLTDKKCQKKWKTLRDSYVRELNHKEMKKPWKYVKQMEFLKDHISTKIVQSLEAFEQIVNGQMDTSADEPSPSPSLTNDDESLEPPLTRSGSSKSQLKAPEDSANVPSSSTHKFGEPATRANVPSSSSHKFGEPVTTPAVKQVKARKRKVSSDTEDHESLNQFYQQLIEIVKPDERNEVDMFFEQIGKTVKSSDLSNIQFLDLQSKLTMFVKIQLLKYKEN